MKYFTAVALVLFAGCHSTVPVGDEAFDVTVTVYERGTVVSDLYLEVLPGVAFTAERYYGAPEPLSVSLAMEINHGESPGTVRVAGSILVNDRIGEPDMNMILGTATDIELHGADLIVRMTVERA